MAERALEEPWRNFWNPGRFIEDGKLGNVSRNPGTIDLQETPKDREAMSSPDSEFLGPGDPRDESFEQLAKQVAMGGGIALAGSVIGQVIIFALHIVLGRVLGPVTYGLYALGTGVMGISIPVASLGLNRGVVRFCSIYRGQGDHARVKGVMISALVISAISGIVIAGVLIALSSTIAHRFFNEPSLVWVLRVVALSLPFYVLVEITVSFAQSFRRMGCQRAQRIFAALVNMALVSFAFLLGFRLAGAVCGFLLSGVLSAGAGFYFLWRIFPEMRSAIRPTFDQVNRLIRFSLPMTFVTMLYILARKTDRIMLGALRGTRDVGIYNAAANLALHLTLVYGALVSISMPIISDTYSKRQLDKVKNLYNMVKRWSSYATLFLSMPVVFYPKIAMWIYGGKFIEGWVTLMILPAAYIIGTLVGPTGALLQMTGKQDTEFFSGFLMVTTNVGLNYLLIPAYGHLGAAIATSSSVFLMNAAQVCLIYRFFGFHPFDAKHIGFAGLVCVIFAVGVTANVLAIPRCIKLSSFLLAVALLLGLIYKSRDGQDEVIWEAIKTRLLGDRS